MTSGIFPNEPGNTPLTPEEERDLIPSIATRAELNQLERYNINEARVWAMRRRTLKRDDLLSDGFARELHRRMFDEMWGWAGKYRLSERNLGWEWQRIPEGVRAALDDAAFWDRNGTYLLPEAAVRLHYKLVLIHPWPNGNGRHARLMADIWCVARGLPEPTWGAGADLMAVGGARDRYLAALQAADQNDFAPLLAFAQS